MFAVHPSSNKYNVSGLIKACVDFPKAKLRNVLVALGEARYLQREHIDVNVGALILSEEFLQIDQKLLCEILDRDELMINEEIAIWNAALCWADEKCRQNGKEQLSAENRRAMLGPALVKIRFPLISQEDFSEIIVPSGVLTDAEKLSVVLHYLSPDRALPEPYQLKFPTNGRAGTKSGLTLQNRWDSAACHEDLTLIEPNRLIVQNTNPLIIQNNGDDEEWCSVLAERPIPTGKFGIFYYEVKILVEKYDFLFGLGTKKMPLDKWVGNYKGTCAYDGSCHFWGHAAEGCSYSYGRPCIDGQPKFGTGDVVGCGINLATRQIFYTMNGKSLDTVDLFVDSAPDELFPCVSLLHSGDKIEANFGPNFEYKL
uniref:B30.2/SPRY domain-containing protein n=1 Tax=Globodera rostochiensis TaxID=31243 RepID=A0A914I378_GLORO